MIYLISPKSAYAANRLALEARIKNYELRIMDIADLAACNFQLTTLGGDVLYIRNPYLKDKADYLEKIIKLAQSFQAQGGRVVDENITQGNLGKGKWEDYKNLKKTGLLIPKTWKYESRIMNYGSKLGTKRFLSAKALAKAEALSTFILKWVYGLKARGTFHINSQISNFKFQNIIGRHPLNEWMWQEYIEADYEYKIITVGYKALPVILRFRFNKKFGRVDFDSFSVIASASDLSAEASAKVEAIYENRLPRPSDAFRARNDKYGKLIKLAEKASRTLGRELAKVDILEKNGKFYILEVNRFPGLKSFEQYTEYNVFENFIEYLAALAPE